MPEPETKTKAEALLNICEILTQARIQIHTHTGSGKYLKSPSLDFFVFFSSSFKYFILSKKNRPRNAPKKNQKTGRNGETKAAAKAFR